MSKNFHLIMFWINALFVVLNGALMYFVSTPSINLICALFCLGGCLCSWSLYKDCKE